jgi:hypothetical protein
MNKISSMINGKSHVASLQTTNLFGKPVITSTEATSAIRNSKFKDDSNKIGEPRMSGAHRTAMITENRSSSVRPNPTASARGGLIIYLQLIPPNSQSYTKKVDTKASLSEMRQEWRKEITTRMRFQVNGGALDVEKESQYLVESAMIEQSAGKMPQIILLGSLEPNTLTSPSKTIYDVSQTPSKLQLI